MMNEERAVLDFFSQPENLPLALGVAEQVDVIRLRMNNEFWRTARTRIANLATDWQVAPTEDRNTPGSCAGLHLQPAVGQNSYLQPMMEQQITEGEIRIYFGLMWNTPPAVGKTSLAEITSLLGKLQSAGYKNNDRFLAWRWTSLYPRRKHFLLQLSARADELINEAIAPLLDLLTRYAIELRLANAALGDESPNATISLDQLRMNLQPKKNS